ncbi:retron St85 family RNA-directed DNA polymerase [Flavobacterium sp. WC2409]|uniref:RNA-directed DNA polymerase n=1 Tax=Flavobacterium sp. WC2409 TaxID=3234139 RepID=A0AB39W3Q8_9FLAO
MTEEYQIEIAKWSDFITKNIRGKKSQEALTLYVQNIIVHNAPVIIDFNHLAELLGIQKEILASIVMKSSSFYYNFEIPKRNGGSRQISAPYPVLLHAQRWIYENILIQQPLHTSSKGFVKNVSIVDNAKEHLNQKCLLKMDIENFFPSIKINRIISIFRNLGYTKKISYYLASICCSNQELPQGAATSPTLSNIIAKRLDYRLNGFANKFHLKYTRYADDFTFSGETIPYKLISYIEKIVKEEGFVVKADKTKLLSEKKQKIITGISISSGKLTIPKKTKREVRKNIHFVLTKGLFVHQKHIKSYDPIYLERLLGYLFFWYSVEPNNSFVLNSIRELKNYSKKLDSEYTLYKNG